MKVSLLHQDKLLGKLQEAVPDFDEDVSTCKLIGVYDDSLSALLAVIAFHRYTGCNVDISMAGFSPRWASRALFRYVFNYVFNQLGVHRVTCITRESNLRTQRFLKGIGFSVEGYSPLAVDRPLEGVYILGMLRHSCKWL